MQFYIFNKEVILPKKNFKSSIKNELLILEKIGVIKTHRRHRVR